jgi:hypothetical protein
VTNSSVNFGFLAKHGDILVRHGALAERYVFNDPNAALVKIRQLAETLARQMVARIGLASGGDTTFRDVERSLNDAGVLDQSLAKVMQTLWRKQHDFDVAVDKQVTSVLQETNSVHPMKRSGQTRFGLVDRRAEN